MNPKDESTIVKFGEAVKRYRKQQKLTLVQLAELCDVDYTTISRIERGKINTTITLIARLAKALQVRPAALLGDQRD